MPSTLLDGAGAGAGAGVGSGSDALSWSLLSDPTNMSVASSPTWSPNGCYLAYLSMNRAGYESDMMHVEAIELATGKRSNLTGHLDVGFDGIVWDVDRVQKRDGGVVKGDIFATGQYRGSSRIFRLSIAESASGSGPSVSAVSIRGGG